MRFKEEEDVVNTIELQSPEYEIKMYSNGFQVLSELNLPVEVEVFDEIGRKLFTVRFSTNTFEALDAWKDKLLLRFNIGGVVVSKPFFKF